MRGLTREERLVAGWIELWGCYEPKSRAWRWINPYNGIACYVPSPRTRWGTDRKTALAEAASTHDEYGIYARRFWRRKKAKPASALKVGDTVTITGTVVNASLSGRMVKIKARTGNEWFFHPDDVDLVEVRRP